MKEKYKKEVLPHIKKEFSLKNNLAAPRLIKTTVNVGVGRMMNNAGPGKAKEELMKEMKKIISLLTGQTPVEAKAKKSIASFKTRQGMPIGIMVTLRGEKMYDFLDRLVNIVLPRVRDFRGLPEKNVDQNGNLNIGIKETTVFPEFPQNSSKNVFGLQVTITVDSKNREMAVALFKKLGFPIK